MWTNGKKPMKVIYVNAKPNTDFDRDQIYDAYYPVDVHNGAWLAIKDRHGEWYAYPTSWFEFVEEDAPVDNN